MTAGLAIIGGFGLLLAIAVLLSPAVLRWLAAHLLAQAEAVEAYNHARADGLRHWRIKLEVSER